MEGCLFVCPKVLVLTTMRSMDLRVADLEVFLAVHRAQAITGAARQLRTTPGAVSKAVTRLERALHLSLLSRGSRGVALTADGLRVVPLFEQALSQLHRAAGDGGAVLTIAGPSFLLDALLPVCAARVPEARFRALHLHQLSASSIASREQFDAAFFVGEPMLPSTWDVHALGVARYGLLANPKLAGRLRHATVERIRAVPMIAPLAWEHGQWVQTDDGCPLGPTERRLGHEVQTIALGLELAVTTEQLVFGPLLAARRFLQRGLLVEVPVAGWAVAQPLRLAVNVDRLNARQARALIDAARAFVGQG